MCKASLIREKIKTDQKGALTIETAIVTTIVLIVVTMLIAMTLIMYEQVRIHAIAQDAAERTAIIYSVKNKDMVTGRIPSDSFEATDYNVYWRVIDFGSNNERITKTEDYIMMKMNAYKVNSTNYTKDNVDVTFMNYFLYKRVAVEIDCEYNVPFGGLLQLFIENPYPIQAKAQAAISEQAEMIRNVDMIRDLLIAKDLFPDFAGKVSAWGEKLSSVLDK